MKKILIILFLFFPFLSLAQRALEARFPGMEEDPSLPAYVLYLFNFSFLVFGFIIFVAIFSAGISYVLSTGNEGKTKEAKKRIKSSIFGFLILAFSFLIFYTINPNLVNIDLPRISFVRSPLFYTQRPVRDELDSISKEVPLGRVLEDVLLKEEEIITAEENISNETGTTTLSNNSNENETKIRPLGKIEKLVDATEFFLTQEIEVDGPSGSVTFDRLSNLSKYLETLTEKCKASNLVAICTESESSSRPQECQGDVCLLDQDQDDGAVRGDMNEIILINNDKIHSENEIQDPVNMQDDLVFDALNQIPPLVREYTTEYQKK